VGGHGNVLSDNIANCDVISVGRTLVTERLKQVNIQQFLIPSALTGSAVIASSAAPVTSIEASPTTTAAAAASTCTGRAPVMDRRLRACAEKLEETRL
jgi:hydroxymethylglutaryl-CoA reductase